MADAAPSSLAVACSVGLVTLILGYFLGQGSSLGLFGGSKGAKPTKKANSWPNSYDVTIHPDSSDEELMNQLKADRESDEESDVEELSDASGEVKLVLVVRTDLGMGKGKIAAQCSHATLACYKSLIGRSQASSILSRWGRGGQTKIAVQVKSEEDMMVLQAQAMSLGLCAKVIHDAGRTQIAAGSATVLGVLGPKSVLDQVTGQLKLL